jgi:Raf kinase inhibitor-like YbhB/YbcL family protein
MHRPLVSGIVVLLLAACGGDDTGGAAATGGAVPITTGGTGATGGTSAVTGGMGAATGGAGGTAATGGMTAAGGMGATGGMVATGGMGATGGTGAGAAAGMAGAMATGGTGGGAFELTSTAVMDGQMIPAMYRCDGPSPALSWTAGPAGTMSYALVFKDITPGLSMNFMHWTVYDIPATTMGFTENATPAAPAMQGPNWQNANEYSGPCAPFGMNTYTFTLFALPTATLTVTGGNVEGAAMAASPLGMATLTIKSMP